jgi:low affinity Fe/Cu permease
MISVSMMSTDMLHSPVRYSLARHPNGRALTLFPRGGFPLTPAPRCLVEQSIGNERWTSQLGRKRDMEALFEKAANTIARAMGRPLAFLLCCLLVIVWAASGPVFHFSDTWQLVINTGTTIVTFLMVFLIQNSQNREGEALQAKLDELIRAIEAAENRYIGLEKRSEHEIEAIRAENEPGSTGDADLEPTRAGSDTRISAA